VSWRLIIATEVRGRSPLGFHNWTPVYALENAEGELTGWYSEHRVGDLCAEGRRLGINLTSDSLWKLRKKAIDRWVARYVAKHGIPTCARCHQGKGKIPSGKHPPTRHTPYPQWAHSGGGTPGKMSDRELVHIFPDGSYHEK
jgi:hypothetical protein